MTTAGFEISRNTQVTISDVTNPILKNAQAILQRDISKTTFAGKEQNEICLVLDHDTASQSERYYFNLKEGKVTIKSTSSIGVMYGVLAVSRSVLGIDDFWYWMDTPVDRKESILWTNFNLNLPKYKTKYRGWFINDELLLMKWEDHDSNSYVWQRAFETALRVGCNVIIPGTDLTSHKNRQTASEYGLIIAQHHAEPLGAAMFARKYPNLTASYIKYPNLFRQLWKDAILAQQGLKVVYSLGFRGQGDKPFWEDDDSREWTKKAISRVINQIIKEQYEMVKKYDPDAPMAINIYGELTGLYRDGLLELPDDVIEIWADSGYGKMVSRRQGIDNPRVPILNVPNPHHRQRGLYCHAGFHDLQASNFLGLMSNSPAFVSSELCKARQNNMDTIELVNTGNIKPHILHLREYAKSWREDYQERSLTEILSKYVETYYSESRGRLVQYYKQYWENVVQYGEYEDETAGDEFAPFLIRRIIQAWVTPNGKLTDAGWLVNEGSLSADLKKIKAMVEPSLPGWAALIRNLEILLLEMKDQHNRNVLYGDLYMSAINQSAGLHALVNLIKAYETTQEAHEKDDLIYAFLQADNAVRMMNKILVVIKNNPSPKWRDFYENDADNDVPLTVKKLKFLRQYLRNLGDTADEDDWERRFVKLPGDARVMTLWTTHREMSDAKLADKLREILIDKL
ncbi:hypothetical protein GIX82_06590 [Lactobacillus reuteri]|nr:hypothetical protein [Limosilactobacillus reuteri]